MIGRLRGEIVEVAGGMVVVEAAGVGYEVIVPESVVLQMPTVGAEVQFYIRQVIREDSHTLYGFLLPFQRRLFDLLLDVTGCGPKVGLSLIGQLGEDAVAGAILSQDARALTRASGVGAKLADRIVLELKEKIANESLQRKIESTRQATRTEDPVVDALIALGFRRLEAQAAADAVLAEGNTVEEQLRAALRNLAK